MVIITIPLKQSDRPGGGSFGKKIRLAKNRPPNSIFTHGNFFENIVADPILDRSPQI